MISMIGRAGAVFQQQTLEAAIVCFSHGGVHADVGCDSRQDQIVDSARAQDELEIGRAERALARLVDDHLARQRCELGNNFPPRLTAHEDSSAWTGIANARADATRAPALVLGK